MRIRNIGGRIPMGNLHVGIQLLQELCTKEGREEVMYPLFSLFILSFANDNPRPNTNRNGKEPGETVRRGTF